MMNEAAFIRERLQDELSRKIFDCRFGYYLDGNISHLRDELCHTIESYRNKRDRCPMMYDFCFEDVGAIIIFGAGNWGKTVVAICEYFGKPIAAIVDSTVTGDVFGFPVRKPLEVDFGDSLIIIANAYPSQIDEIKEQLIKLGVDEKQFRFVQQWANPKQYFDEDIVNSFDDEVYISCGVYDGFTLRQFLSFAVGKVKMFGFEPQPNYFEQCSAMNFPDATLFNNALWSENKKLKFDINGSMSRVNGNAQFEIEAVTIDETIPDQEIVSFISMDIEGAELEALKGAKGTIRRSLPRLAISVYHKPEDIIEIPEFIINNFDGYKLWLRHEQFLLNDETVLYAVR